MGRLNYSARKIDGLKVGQVLAKDLRKRIPPETASRAATRDPYLEIDIASKGLTDQGLAQFIDDLITCLEFRDRDHPQGVGRLTELHLQNNALTTRSLMKLSRVIVLSAGDLRELDLSGNEIRVVTPEQGLAWQQFLDSFRHCYMLKKLDFSHNPLGSRGIEILARVYMRSELDFVEVDGEDDVVGNASQLEVLSGGFTSLRIENNNQENERPLARASDGQHSKSRPLQSSKNRSSSLTPLEKTVTKTDIKRYASTRGLRSIPYLIISNVSMTDACAIHLSSVLSIHWSPEHLLAYLPGGKALSLPDPVGRCNGIIWLPNRDLGTLAQQLLAMTEEFRDWGSNSDSDDRVGQHSRRLPLASRDRSHDEHIKQRQIRKKRDIEYMRLTKRVRIDILKVEGVHSADIWSAALRMVVVCRALLLEDRDRPVSNMSAVETSAEVRHGINPEVAQMDVSYPGPFHPTTKGFAHHFPTIQGVSTVGSLGTPSLVRLGRDREHTPSRSAKVPVRASNASTSVPPQKEVWRFRLPTEAWRRIIAHAVNAEGILDRDQQIQIMRYASDWGALSQELAISGAADYQQIWKILDSVGCFTYSPWS
ncbi:hypothetical protein Egran_03661 [Elaphomyces granulatus]|uniref:Leucine rich repeat protein n=1 Tax=Elaphomyces granulatus TaxID=519963 RepID=A0A232LWN8_9EURO|nr:hypothetical protein Egran_03661 [Elaphomyces granulatus]